MFYITEIGINQAGCSSDTECATSSAVCSSGSCVCPMKYFFDNDNCVESKLHRGSNMSAHVLLNSLNKLGKRDKMRGVICEACRAFYLFFAMRLIKLIIQEHEC